MGILYALYRYRIRQLKRILTLRNRISRDLHDDIGSTLGSISIYSEVAKNVAPENRTDVLNKIGEASREMIEKLNDLVWSINAENDTLEKMEKRMRSYAAMMLNPLGIAFDLRLKAEEVTTHLNMDHRKNIFLIFKEALHNAAKYSACKLIQILLEEKQGYIIMEIHDDGKGFDPEKKKRTSYGLLTIRERCEEIGGTARLFAREGEGTEWTFKIPCQLSEGELTNELDSTWNNG
jgi:signal transduction histidine kinase